MIPCRSYIHWIVHEIAIVPLLPLNPLQNLIPKEIVCTKRFTACPLVVVAAVANERKFLHLCVQIELENVYTVFK